MLRTENLCAGYKKLQVLFEVSVTVPANLLTVVVGPNGSGKSTLLKTVFGLTKVYSGRIRLDGVDITGLAPHQVASHGVAYVPQLDNVFANLTVYENLLISSYGLGKADSSVLDVMEIFPHLKRYQTKKAALMSGGERQMLAIAMALIRKPKIMLFDEPTGNLSPKMSTTILNIIRDLRDSHRKTILLAEQNAKRALEIGDKAILLVSGRTAFEGDAQTLLMHKELGRLYLGIR
ncbi:MAG: ABC transporter ATP-binding protein [Candidatus Caldarchaeum sp.]